MMRKGKTKTRQARGNILKSTQRARSRSLRHQQEQQQQQKQQDHPARAHALQRPYDKRHYDGSSNSEGD